MRRPDGASTIWRIVSAESGSDDRASTGSDVGANPGPRRGTDSGGGSAYRDAAAGRDDRPTGSSILPGRD